MSRQRAAIRPIAWLGAALLLAGVAPLAGTSPALAQDRETAVRVAAIDGGDGDLTLLDPDAGEGAIVGRFTTPNGGYAYLYPSGNGRYVVANHYDGRHVTIVDSGLSTEDHGDHVDLVEAAPFVLATVATGDTPAHPWAHDGVLAVHNDGDGTVTLFEEADLDEEIVPTTFPVAQPDHSSIAVVDDTVLVGYYDLGRVDAYATDGRLIREDVGACPEAHGEAKFGESIAFACGDGLLLVDPPAGLRATKVPYPAPADGPATPTVPTEADAATPEAGDAEAGPRIGGFATAGGTDVLVGDFGQAVVFVRPDGEGASFEVLPLPAEPVGMTYDSEGEMVAVLTDDGAVHAIDPATAEILWSTAAVTPYAEISIDTGFQFYPSIAASSEAVYAPDPTTGEVVELSLEDGEETNRFAIGGQPSKVTVVSASGVAH